MAKKSKPNRKSRAVVKPQSVMDEWREALLKTSIANLQRIVVAEYKWFQYEGDDGVKPTLRSLRGKPRKAYVDWIMQGDPIFEEGGLNDFLFKQRAKGLITGFPVRKFLVFVGVAAEFKFSGYDPDDVIAKVKAMDPEDLVECMVQNKFEVLKVDILG